MPFKIFTEELEESKWFCPHDRFPKFVPTLRLLIRRSGCAAYRQHVISHQSTKIWEAIQDQLKKKAVTVKDTREGSFTFESEFDEIPIGDLDLSHFVSGGDPEGMVLLIAESEGLIKDDGTSADNDPAAFKELLSEHVPLQAWVLEKAQELQAAYDVFFEVTEKNSGTSSGPRAQEEATN